MSYRSWAEALHPREHGKFASKPGGASGRMADVKVTKAVSTPPAAKGRRLAPRQQQLADELGAARNHYGYVYGPGGKPLANGWLRGVHDGELHVHNKDGSVTKVPVGDIKTWNHEAGKDNTPYQPGDTKPADDAPAPAAKPKAAPAPAKPAPAATGKPTDTPPPAAAKAKGHLTTDELDDIDKAVAALPADGTRAAGVDYAKALRAGEDPKKLGELSVNLIRAMDKAKVHGPLDGLMSKVAVRYQVAAHTGPATTGHAMNVVDDIRGSHKLSDDDDRKLASITSDLYKGRPVGDLKQRVGSKTFRLADYDLTQKVKKLIADLPDEQR